MTAPFPPPVADSFDLAAFGRRIVLAAIRGERDDTECKQRIMIARDHGHLSDDETEFYIAAWGLQAA